MASPAAPAPKRGVRRGRAASSTQVVAHAVRQAQALEEQRFEADMARLNEQLRGPKRHRLLSVLAHLDTEETGGPTDEFPRAINHMVDIGCRACRGA